MTMPARADTEAAALARLRQELEAEARVLGFAGLGVTRPYAVRAAGERLRAWVAAGMHGDMEWMVRRLDWRADPETLWPAARSVVMLAESYAPADDPLAALGQPDQGAISVYARGRDFQGRVKKRLKRLGRWLVAAAGRAGLSCEIKVFVDTAPVMEKPLAAAAGVGWQGKHTNLVSRRLGSWFFLGAIFTTLELPVDAPHGEHCGSCRRCLDVCPTAAFPAPFVLDARRCISYLTIELRGPIPRPMRPLIGNRIFGCDDCLAVCPWNRFARAASTLYGPVEGARETPLAELAALDDAAFRARFRGTPVKRLGRTRFLRNVMVAIGNSGEPELAGAARRALDEPEPLIRAHAVWALSRLLDTDEFAALARLDPEPLVAEEWRLAFDEARARGP